MKASAGDGQVGRAGAEHGMTAISRWSSAWKTTPGPNEPALHIHAARGRVQHVSSSGTRVELKRQIKRNDRVDRDVQHERKALLWAFRYQHDPQHYDSSDAKDEQVGLLRSCTTK